MLLSIVAAPARAYRPFISTDASVADPRMIEIEYGFFGLDRTRGRTFYVPAHAVLNYGFATDLEAVGEVFVVKPAGDEARVADPNLAVKGVLKEGVLQDQPGISLAVEAGPLLPSRAAGERRFGFEGAGILSAALPPLIVHLNLGGGVARVNAEPFVEWGLIGEMPLFRGLRLVGEVSGQDTDGALPDTSGLIGFLYRVPDSETVFDIGVRKGFARGAADWGITVGVTFSYSLPRLASSLDVARR